jgi:hypothetical protein
MNADIPITFERAEVELLLSGARARVDAETAARINALARNIDDWDYLIRLGTFHRVLPLLYRTFKQTCWKILPASTSALLRNHFDLNTKRNFLLTAELLKLLSAFELHGIKAVSFKGPILAASIYGNIALREFRDLDILVRKKDISKASDILISEGFTFLQSTEASHEIIDRTLEPDLLAPLNPNFYTFVRDGGVNVDLQWRITRRLFSFSLDSEQLWNNLQDFPLGGRIISTFRPETLLPILCAHGFKHSWRRLKWICDIAELVECYHSGNYTNQFDRALGNGGRRMVSLGLLLAHEVLKAPLPSNLVKEIRSDSLVKSSATQVCQGLFVEPHPPPKEADSFIAYFRMAASWREKIRYTLHYLGEQFGSVFAPTSIEHLVLPLPRRLMFLYYAFRPVRLITKYTLLAFRKPMSWKPNPMERVEKRP